MCAAIRLERGRVKTPWHSRGFVVKDCEGRLLAWLASRAPNGASGGHFTAKQKSGLRGLSFVFDEGRNPELGLLFLIGRRGTFLGC